MQGSTSIHSLNADKKMSLMGRVAYLLLNNVNNLLPSRHVDDRICQRHFETGNLFFHLKNLSLKDSPGRVLSDLFWCDLDWSGLKKYLGEIRVLDVGCGPGSYHQKLKSFSDSKLHSYHGIDIYESEAWKCLAGRDVAFDRYDGTDIAFALDRKPNLIISQSAFEHVEHDLLLAQQLASYQNGASFPVIQIHLVPSAIGLMLYLFHGCRQYTIRHLSKITKLFDNENRIELFSMGGKKCNLLHWRYITLPMIFRKRDRRYRRDYKQLLFDAVQEKSSKKVPNFYALVIKKVL